MSEESAFCMFELPRPFGHSLLSKSESYLSLTPPLSLEEVAFMPEVSDFCIFELPRPFGHSLLSKSESFVFFIPHPKNIRFSRPPCERGQLLGVFL